MNSLRRTMFGKLPLYAAAIFLCFNTMVGGTDISRINKLAQECSAGKAKACQKLAEIAMNDRSWPVCEAAAKALTDQSLLADIVMHYKFEDVAEAAFEKLTDQTQLGRIAKNHKEYMRRQETVEKLTDQVILVDIAKNDPNDWVKSTAIMRLTDQALLVEFARNKETRWGAVQNPHLSDQALLADIAKNDNDEDIRLFAVNNPSLSDQAMIGDVAKSASDNDVRRAAAMRLTDQAILAAIAKIEKDSYVLKGIFENTSLKDEHALSDIALTAADEEASWLAARKLTDPALLAQVAKNKDSEHVGCAAVQSRNLNDQALFAEIARIAVNEGTRICALAKITDGTVLDAIMRDKRQSLSVRLEAVSHLGDTKRFAVGQFRTDDVLFEIRQRALEQKNIMLFKAILKKSAPEAVARMRKRASKLEVQGRLMKRESREPLANVIIFLGEMKGEHECTIYKDLAARTDSTGHFILRNVPSGYYTIAYSTDQKAELPVSAIFRLDSEDFNTSMERGSFSNGSLHEGTSTISSSRLGMGLSFEVRNSEIVEFDVAGTATRRVVFEIY